MGRVDGKVALVTGGGSGIGAAACRTLAREGTSVAVVDYRLEAAEGVASELKSSGAKAIAVRADVRVEADMKEAVSRTVSELGGLHFVFANAGINGMQCPIEEMTVEEWDATIDTNMKGTFLTIKHSIPHLRAAGGGSVVVTASVNGFKLFSAAGYSAYSTSKAGQVAYAKMAAQELARWDIRVNVICPGAIKTNIGERTYQRNLEKVRWDIGMPGRGARRAAADGGQRPVGAAGAIGAGIIDEHGTLQRFPPLYGRSADAGEVADLVLFLASDESRYITGAEILIDAGLTLLRG
ncbi:MAG TPA: SDR family NAD(P)-dependent oxidoreductase [Chloroflexota bacterium]|nr:SDR family NAD(P)-dependent oxidoreductase [Chloroflexota bacterium]